MNRRQFLVYGALAGVSVATSGAWWMNRRAATIGPAIELADGVSFVERLERSRRLVDDEEEARLLALAPRFESAAAIGTAVDPAYSRVLDEGRLLDTLRRKLRPDATVSAELVYEPLQERFQTQVQDDFAHGRTVVVDGWLLAETTVELCILAMRVSERNGAGGAG
jgi:hypothetical protein